MLRLPRPKKSLRGYMTQYRAEHQHIGTKITHMIGIPMIVASIPTAVVNPPLAGGMFVGGWALQFLGHYAFEKQKPSFFGDPYYLFVGPVWVAVEYAELVGLPIPEALTPLEDVDAEVPAVPVENGVVAQA